MDITSNNRQINPLHLSNQFLSLPPTIRQQEQQQQQQPFIPNPIPFVTIVGPLQSNSKNNYNNRSTSIHNSFLITNPESSSSLPRSQQQQFPSDPNQLSNIWQLYDDPNSTNNKLITNKKHPKQPIISYPNHKKQQQQPTNSNHKVLRKEKLKNPSSSSLINNKKFLNGNYTRAKRCIPEQCQPPDCRCGGLDIPGLFFDFHFRFKFNSFFVLTRWF